MKSRRLWPKIKEHGTSFGVAAVGYGLESQSVARMGENLSRSASNDWWIELEVQLE